MLRLRSDSDQIISTNTTCTEKFRGKAPEKCYSSSRCKVYTLHSGILMVANECPADQENNLFKFLWTIATECSISRNDCPLEVTSLTKGQYFFQLHISQPGCIWGSVPFEKKSGRGDHSRYSLIPFTISQAYQVSWWRYRAQPILRVTVKGPWD